MPIECIVIAGGGVAGWMAAGMLSRKLDMGMVTITVIEANGIDDSLGIACPIETMLPATCATSAVFGYDEDVLIRAMRASFNLGTALNGWSGSAAPAFLPFGTIGAAMGPIAFHQLAARLRSEGLAVNLANYALGPLCAQTGRVARPVPGNQSVHSTLAYGLSIDCHAYAAALKADAVARGVAVIAGHVTRAETGADGLTTALIADNGQAIAGDLFIDATGPQSVLQGTFQDWSVWLPCNRAAAVQKRSSDSPLPYAHLEAHHAGWQRFSALRDATGEAFVYHADSLPDGPTASPFASGRRLVPWHGNIVAIGGSAAVIDPVAGTQLHLAQSAIARLLTLFPNDRTCSTEAAEYNRQTIDELECARDYAILSYKGNKRVGHPFWDQCRAMSVPDRLAHKIALYESCGRVALHDGETFEEPQWIALFDALGYRPRRYDALANGIERTRIEDHFARIRDVMLKAVATMPTQGDYLRSINR
jgi:tryptophan 7-halogenase